VAGISEQGRATQGVKLIRIDEGDAIAAITNLTEQEEEENNGEENSAASENGTAHQQEPGT
jgi:DNA gyrase subunit A